MLLIQCFQSVVSLVEDLAHLDKEEIAVGPLRDSFVEAINASARNASEEGFKERQIESAKFAYAVMIDEVMLTRSEIIELEWKTNLLQEKFFGTITGGDRVFSQMRESLDPLPANYDIQLVYLNCLDSGLVASLHKDSASVDAVKYRLRESIQMTRRTMINPDRLCPSAYHGLGEKGTVKRHPRKSGLVTANLIGLIGLVGVYLYFSQTIEKTLTVTADSIFLGQSGQSESTEAKPPNQLMELIQSMSSGVFGKSPEE
ncbi:MAG: hypothetical protein HN900_20330 [Gammaproteobacteria bacterium]|nr:hypothetical protein [Acidiferrobacteraceae bacterium]MBT4987330.1 hypothetical protein [Pseudomonadota bacterium]MBT5624203.1 hypothetical protein [Pseudomonadota bacterium]MBT6067012.1 hypothetical protein [Pseudomonadota bacterium]MBT7177034.1 hypothetical protein [Gammaproteobacteria bacterium]